jgi:hypothetical protein
MCTDAYREALTRDLSSTASSAPTQRQAVEPGREGVVGRPLRRCPNPGQDELESHGVAAAGGDHLHFGHFTFDSDRTDRSSQWTCRLQIVECGLMVDSEPY